MKTTVQRVLHDTSGQDLIEYALLVAVLGVACITGILQLTRIKDFFVLVGQALADAL